jgi:phosphate:Na+ symporter
VLNAPSVALEATRRALSEIACETWTILREAFNGAEPNRDRVEPLREALRQTEQFFAQIPPISEDAPLSASRLAQMHAIDHLLRLQSRLLPEERILQLLSHERLQPGAAICRNILDLAEAGLHERAPSGWLEIVEQRALSLAEMRRAERTSVLQQTAGGAWQPGEALEALDAMRWQDRVGYHTWRIANYLSGEPRAEPVIAPR